MKIYRWNIEDDSAARDSSSAEKPKSTEWLTSQIKQNPAAACAAALVGGLVVGWVLKRR